ncbi:unnamed protein product [Closterium sp. NIES-54]
MAPIVRGAVILLVALSLAASTSAVISPFWGGAQPLEPVRVALIVLWKRGAVVFSHLPHSPQDYSFLLPKFDPQILQVAKALIVQWNAAAKKTPALLVGAYDPSGSSNGIKGFYNGTYLIGAASEPITTAVESQNSGVGKITLPVAVAAYNFFVHGPTKGCGLKTERCRHHYPSLRRGYSIHGNIFGNYGNDLGLPSIRGWSSRPQKNRRRKALTSATWIATNALNGVTLPAPDASWDQVDLIWKSNAKAPAAVSMQYVFVKKVLPKAGGAVAKQFLVSSLTKFAGTAKANGFNSVPLGWFNPSANAVKAVSVSTS